MKEYVTNIKQYFCKNISHCIGPHSACTLKKTKKMHASRPVISHLNIKKLSVNSIDILIELSWHINAFHTNRMWCYCLPFSYDLLVNFAVFVSLLITIFPVWLWIKEVVRIQLGTIVFNKPPSRSQKFQFWILRTISTDLIVAPANVHSMICANGNILYGLKIVFAFWHITPSDYHHYAELFHSTGYAKCFTITFGWVS